MPAMPRAPWGSAARQPGFIFASFIASTLAIAACGSSSGGGALSGNLGFQAVGVSGYQAFRGQADFPYAALQFTLPSSSPFTHHARSARGTAPIFESELGLYYVETTSGSTATIAFFTDAAGTQAAGSMILSGLTGALGNYASYPATLTGTIDITGGKLPCNGALTINIQDGEGKNELKGNLTLPETHVSLTFDFTLDDTGNVGGSSVISEHGSTISMTGISGGLASKGITGNVVVTPSNWTGVGAFSLTTGEFSVSLATGSGHSSASSNASGGLVFTFADGTTETIPQPLTEQPDNPLSSGGSDAGQAGNDGGTRGGDGGTYAAASFADLRISAKSADGRFGGQLTSTNPSSPAYLAPGTTAAQTLALGGNSTGIVYGINSHGAIVGVLNLNNYGYNYDLPAYWSSPTAQPVILKLFAGDVAGMAIGINDSGQIVAAGYDGYYHHVIYYSSPAADPVALSTVGVVYDAYQHAEGFPLGINNHGEIIGDYFYSTGTSANSTYINNGYAWTSPTAAPIALALPSGDTNSQPQALNDSGAIVGTSAPDYYSNLFHAVLWTSPSAQPTQLAEYNGQPITAATDINASGAIVGCTGTDTRTTSLRPGLQWEPDLSNMLEWTGTSHALAAIGACSGEGTFITDSGVIADGSVVLTPR